jgi:hypothetical protein
MSAWIYREIWVEKRPGPYGKEGRLPDKCPICNAIRLRLDSRGTPWEAADYKCGGMYKSKPQIQNHTDKWWGWCPTAKEVAKSLGLSEDVPTTVLQDAMKEQGVMD